MGVSLSHLLFLGPTGLLICIALWEGVCVCVCGGGLPVPVVG